MKKALMLLLCCLLLPIPCRGEGALTDAECFSYYQHAFFIGDSITRTFANYVYGQRQEDPAFLAGAKFFAVKNYALRSVGSRGLSSNGADLQWNGRAVSLYEIVELLRPERVLVLAGVNDYAGEHIEKSLTYVEKMAQNLGKASPDTQIIMISLTPVATKFCRKTNYQALWDDYNAALEEACARLGLGFLDLASYLKGEDGYLLPDYCGDGEYHLSRAGNAQWAQALLDYAQAAYAAGEWGPKE